MGKKMVTYNGQTHCQAEWARLLNMSVGTFARRLGDFDGDIGRVIKWRDSGNYIKRNGSQRPKRRRVSRPVVPQVIVQPEPQTKAPPAEGQILLYTLRALLDAPLSDGDARAAVSLMLERAGY